MTARKGLTFTSQGRPTTSSARVAQDHGKARSPSSGGPKSEIGRWLGRAPSAGSGLRVFQAFPSASGVAGHPWCCSACSCIALVHFSQPVVSSCVSVLILSSFRVSVSLSLSSPKEDTSHIGLRCPLFQQDFHFTSSTCNHSVSK